MKTEKEVVSALESHIADECTRIDREARFDDMLDECYSFEKVGGIFATMSPSRVLKEVDPIAYRCGVNDFEDSEEWVDVDGEYYEQDEAEKAKAEFLENLESEAEALEQEIEDMEAEEDVPNPLAFTAELKAKREALTEKQAEIAIVEKHSF